VRTAVGVAVSGKVQVAETVSPPAMEGTQAATEIAEAVSQQVLPALVVSRDLSRRVLVVAQSG
jgi:F420-dependent methylenetetrahydromethanopterin dehydrogenase